MKILALDVGKFKSVACIWQRGEYSFETIETRREPLGGLIERHRPDLLVVEAGPQNGWMRDAAAAAGVDVQVANTADQRWRWRNTKRKTDRDDALRLARMTADGDLPTVHAPSAESRRLRELIHRRKAAVGRRTMIKNEIRALLDQHEVRLPSGKTCWTQAQLAELDAMARSFDQAGDELWRVALFAQLIELRAAAMAVEQFERALDALTQKDDRVKLLRTVPGVGQRTAEAFVAAVDDPTRFRSGRAVSCYFGLTPRQYESGQMKRSGRISKQGNRLVRGLLVEVAWIALRHNPPLAAMFKRIRRGAKTRHKQAIVAVARKLAVILWAMLRDHRPWSPPVMQRAA